MNGIAIILPGCDFSVKNLGKITFLEDTNLTGLTISGEDVVNGITASYSVGYLPMNTSHRGVTWSILTGDAYASIESNTGLLTVISGANASIVTIKAISTVDNTIIATKNITVTYKETVEEPTDVSIIGNGNVTGKTAQYSAQYTPSNSSLVGGTWSIESGGSYATINQEGLLTVVGTITTEQTVVIKFVTNYNSTITSLPITVTKTIHLNVPSISYYYDNIIGFEQYLSASNNRYVPSYPRYSILTLNKTVNACKFFFNVGGNITLGIYNTSNNTLVQSLGSFEVVTGENIIKLLEDITLLENQTIGISLFGGASERFYNSTPSRLPVSGGCAQKNLGKGESLARAIGYFER